MYAVAFRRRLSRHLSLVHATTLISLMGLQPYAQADERAIIKIELRPFVQTSGAYVSLSDIAKLSSGDLATLRTFMAISLGRAPRVGSAVTLERGEIERWIRGRAGVLPHQVAWEGPLSTEIATAENTLSGTAIQKAARGALKVWLAQHYARVQIDDGALPRDISIPAGQVELRPRQLPVQMQPAERMQVWVDVVVDERFVRTIPVEFLVGAYQQGWVAKKRAAAGAAVVPDDFELREVNVAKSKNISPVAFQMPVPGGTTNAATTKVMDEPIAAMRLRRPVQAGETLSSMNAEIIPPVSRGGMATLIASNGAVTLERQVEVLQDGQVGQLVRVKFPHATSSMQARVTGQGKVEVAQ